MFYKKDTMLLLLYISFDDFKKLVKPRTIFYFFNEQGKKKMKISYFLSSGMQNKRIPVFSSCGSPTVLLLDGSVTSSRIFGKCLCLS